MDDRDGWYGEVGWETEHIVIDGVLWQCDNPSEVEELRHDLG